MPPVDASTLWIWLGAVVIGAVVWILLFLGLRDLSLWYWRITEVVRELRAIRAELTQIRAGSKEEPIQEWDARRPGG